MKKTAPTGPVERMFPFVLRARILLVGGDVLRRSKSKLHFILITRDLAPGSRTAVIEHYTSAELETFFKLKGAKVIGFAKSGLAQSIYAELKQYRINKPVEKAKPAEEK